jgi:hypothetical protein
LAKRKFIIRAQPLLLMLFHSFKVTEVALMMDSDYSTGSGSSEEEGDGTWNPHRPTNSKRDPKLTNSRPSMRGLQVATAEGWIIQRARDMCSFAHDRYRQAALAEAEKLPKETLAKMSFRVCLALS